MTLLLAVYKLFRPLGNEIPDNLANLGVPRRYIEYLFTRYGAPLHRVYGYNPEDDLPSEIMGIMKTSVIILQRSSNLDIQHIRLQFQSCDLQMSLIYFTIKIFSNSEKRWGTGTEFFPDIDAQYNIQNFRVNLIDQENNQETLWKFL